MTRTLTTGGTDVTHFIHDLNGNVIAESSGSGPTSTLREYIWLPGAEISPTMASSGAIDRPIAVVPSSWFSAEPVARPPPAGPWPAAFSPRATDSTRPVRPEAAPTS